MNQKRSKKTYSQEFKKALALIAEQGYSVAKTALSLGLLRRNILYRWKK